MFHPALKTELAFDPSQVIVRPLTADDGLSYRALRQKILDIGDGKYFSDSYERERKFASEEDWRAWCTETDEHCTIGIFIDSELSGIMGIVKYGPAENFTVEWEATWIDPQYRKLGIARLAYKQVQEWTKDRGYEQAVVFIRDGNERSHDIRQKQGAVYLYTSQEEVWADGSIADAHCFLIDLYPAAVGQDKPYERAARRMEATLASLQGEIPAVEATGNRRRQPAA